MLTRLRNYFLTGVIVTAPIALTLYLTWQFIHWVDRQAIPLLPAKYNPENYLPFSLPGLGLVIMLVILTFVGFLTANIFGRTLLKTGERLVNRMPVVRSIYGALKQVLETVLSQSSNSFRQAVLVEYPRRGIWTMAFVTGDTEGEVASRLEDDMVNIYVPTTPNPTSGFLLMVPRRDLIFLDLPVEDAAKYVISIGVISPEEEIKVKEESMMSRLPGHNGRKIKAEAKAKAEAEAKAEDVDEALRQSAE
ncbi:MAG: DUF502 domain-containing protein [Rhodospirillaceae bacterium]|nr:DUF502 domain-containing protein [Rhodospirillaceae bacterium]MBT4691654.1 DUF502 domain-containing protein [Rhodospirillaceae bacterium]MBT5082193.1 DUF502 domain-containing protein [Rhodospirillaceae bacterium]MBT5526712.1 DUF502 domain-containing protein [Rhodospirillaceae bacterium]MBT5879077.1 DUF502 domain-containing protein [Rhodospirillaceae bacterium]